MAKPGNITRFDDFCDPATPNGGSLCRISEAFDPADVIGLMTDIFVSVVPLALREDGDLEPSVPISYGPICRRCGCSGRDACEPSCSWVEADLCSACVGSEGGVDG